MILANSSRLLQEDDDFGAFSLLIFEDSLAFLWLARTIMLETKSCRISYRKSTVKYDRT